MLHVCIDIEIYICVCNTNSPTYAHAKCESARQEFTQYRTLRCRCCYWRLPLILLLRLLLLMLYVCAVRKRSARVRALALKRARVLESYRRPQRTDYAASWLAGWLTGAARLVRDDDDDDGEYLRVSRPQSASQPASQASQPGVLASLAQHCTTHSHKHRSHHK